MAAKISAPGNDGKSALCSPSHEVSISTVLGAIMFIVFVQRLEAKPVVTFGDATRRIRLLFLRPPSASSSASSYAMIKSPTSDHDQRKASEPYRRPRSRWCIMLHGNYMGTFSASIAL